MNADILVTIPRGREQSVPPAIISAIRSQQVNTIVIVEVLGEDPPDRVYPNRRLEALCRDSCCEYLSVQPCWSVMQDRDILHLSPTNFQEMAEFLTKNTDFGAVALWTGPHSLQDIEPLHHVKIACVMIRHELLTDLEFYQKDVCNCLPFMRAIKTKGFRFGYLDNKIRVKEIEG